MSRFSRRLWLMVLGAVLAVSSRATAVAPEIKDEGKFFSAEAVKKADEQIREIARKYGKDLLIETYATVPADQVEKVKAMSKEEREKFFHHWALDRIEARVVNGVYVLICKNPPYLYVEITSKAGSAFSPGDRKKLIQLLAEKLRAKKNEEALLDAVKFVGEKLAAGSGDSK